MVLIVPVGFICYLAFKSPITQVARRFGLDRTDSDVSESLVRPSVDQRARNLVHENPEAEALEVDGSTPQRVKEMMAEHPEAEVFEGEEAAHPQESAPPIANENPEAEGLAPDASDASSAQKKRESVPADSLRNPSSQEPQGSQEEQEEVPAP